MPESLALHLGVLTVQANLVSHSVCPLPNPPAVKHFGLLVGALANTWERLLTIILEYPPRMLQNST